MEEASLAPKIEDNDSGGGGGGGGGDDREGGDARTGL